MPRSYWRDLFYVRGVARIFQRGGHRGYSPDCQSYYRGMKAHINLRQEPLTKILYKKTNLKKACFTCIPWVEILNDLFFPSAISVAQINSINAHTPIGAWCYLCQHWHKVASVVCFEGRGHLTKTFVQHSRLDDTEISANTLAHKLKVSAQKRFLQKYDPVFLTPKGEGRGVSASSMVFFL